jgi:hypothetical protein
MGKRLRYLNRGISTYIVSRDGVSLARIWDNEVNGWNCRLVGEDSPRGPYVSYQAAQRATLRALRDK